MKYKERLQEEEYTCGVYCIEMILDYYHIETTIGEIKKACGLTLSGVTMAGIIAGLKHYGIEAKGYHCSLEDLKGPAILLVENNQYSHYIVFYQHQSRYICNDPDKGIIKYTKGELAHIYQNKAIIIEHHNAYPSEHHSLFLFLLKQIRSIHLFILSLLMLSINLIYQYLLKDYLSSLSNLNILLLIIAFKIILEIFLQNYLLKKQFYYLKQLFLQTIHEVIHLPFEYYLHTRIEDLNTKVERIKALPEYITSVLSDFYIHLCLLILIMIYLFYSDPSFALLECMSQAFIILSFLVMNHRIKKIERKDLLAYHYLIKKMNLILHHHRGYLLNRKETIENEYEQYVEIDQLLHEYYLFFNLLIEYLSLLILLISLQLLQNNLLFMILLVETLNDSLLTLLKHALYYPRMNLIYLDYLDLKDSEIKEEYQLPITSITLDHLSFSYGYHPYILYHTSFCFDHHYYIKGSNGSGKSTLLKVIANEYSNYEGNLYYNDTRMKGKYSHKVIYLDSELRLPDGYISDLFDLEWLKENARECWHLYPLSLHQLSLGNYQLIVFLYSLSLDYDVYLLDECFNHLDDQYIDLVERLLESQLLQEKIVICCEHHLKNIPKSFESVIMDDKKIKGD